MKNPAIIVLRLGLAFVFAYPAVTGFMNPSAYATWIPDFVLGYLPVEAKIFLLFFFFTEVLLVLWLLSGKHGFWAAATCALLLFLITIPNFHMLGVLFRNVGLFSAAVALALLEK